MNKILIVEASESDRRLMSGLHTPAGYEPIAVDKMEAAKVEVAKLPPGAVVVSAISIYFLRSPRILMPASASIGATSGARRATLSSPILR